MSDEEAVVEVEEEVDPTGVLFTLVTAGGEMVGSFMHEDDEIIVLEKPRAFVQTEKGVGFAPSVCLTGQAKPESVGFYKSGVILATPTSNEVEKLWIQATTGLVV